MLKCLVLTGGSHGIGEKTIALFIQNGWQAINISRSACRLPGVQNIAVDLADQQGLEKISAAIQAKVSGAKQLCVVHNAAIFQGDDVRSLTSVALHRVLQVNVVAPVALNAILFPFMRAGSSIVYIGSTLAEQAVANRASYVISKHALVGLMRATCQDLYGEGVHTCCICPGFVNTKMLTEQVEDSAKFDAFIQAKVSAKRLIEPEEIAEFIYFCALHPVVNGAILHANLGQVTT